MLCEIKAFYKNIIYINLLYVKEKNACGRSVLFDVDVHNISLPEGLSRY